MNIDLKWFIKLDICMWKNAGLRPQPHITKKKYKKQIQFFSYYFAMPHFTNASNIDDGNFCQNSERL